MTKMPKWIKQTSRNDKIMHQVQASVIQPAQTQKPAKVEDQKKKAMKPKKEK